MERQKRWQLFLILAVVILTIYNILPTVFYYAKPLKNPINDKKAQGITLSIVDRVNALEKESTEWLRSYCRLLEIKPLSLSLDNAHPQFVNLTFKNLEEANKFRQHFPRAGALIPFAPAQLSLYESPKENLNKTVVVQRHIPLHLDPTKTSSFYQYSAKFDAKGQVTDLYKALVDDRILQLAVATGGVSENAQAVHALNGNKENLQDEELVLMLSQNILSFVKVFGDNTPISARYFASFSQNEEGDRTQAVKSFTQALEQLKDKTKLERIALQQESQRLKETGSFLETVKQQRLELLTQRENILNAAENVVKKNAAAFASGKSPLNYSSFGAQLHKATTSANGIQTFSLENRNPFISDMLIDWKNEKIYLRLFPDVLAFREKLDQNKGPAYLRDQLDQLLYNEIATISRKAGEKISPNQGEFEIVLNALPNSKSFLAMRLSSIAGAEAKQIKETLQATWHPKHPDLTKENFPIWDYETYQQLPAEQQKLGLVIYAPSLFAKMPPQGFRMNSVYVIAKGLDKVAQKIQQAPQSEETKQFLQDFASLREIMQRNGYFGYSGSSFAFNPEFSQDLIFEAEDYYQAVLKATREDFTVHGTKRYAILEFSDLEQRILTENKIETRMHEDLLKWRDDYRAAQLNLKGASYFDIPAPTKNVLFNNFKLSAVKYFRGDDRKILHWGLDLSGGKTVQIELRDSNNRVVKEEADLKQGVNELYNRVNKMGVSEISIRQEGHFITLDFPGSQGLSAAELVKASSMYFHVVNEKFTPSNPNLADAVNKFLQDIWNEALITNQKDSDAINAIAWKHLYGDSQDPSAVQPRSEAAKLLYESGLRFANPQDTFASSNFNDSFSKIALFRGDDFTDWQGQTNPLLIVMRNYALEGANLQNVHASYDPSKGNFLSFEISGSSSAKNGQKNNPRDDLFAWTSQFSKEKIAGTPNEAYSKGRGWRMAVILNGSIISAPTLDSPLSDRAMITGSFSQREVNQLEADLKAGSLTFSPHILSERNVSPDLGVKERTLGIWATVAALILVIAVMGLYYRFAGLIASVAVIFNLLIMWATLQNLQATMTLAGIAGIILTLGMAVDANVLVFERIREEYAASGRIASAIQAGYRKAYSAIVDSNVTTIIAGLLLLHFASGPVKAFAVNLIIGIVSSMFTALFMTRFFFAGWVQNPEHKELKMSNFIKASRFDFLKRTKMALILSTAIIVIGAAMLINQRHSIVGMDFTGGYAISLELQQRPQDNYRQAVENALIRQGAKPQEFQIRELTPSNHIRLFLSRSLQQPGRPFYGMPLQTDLKEPAYSYQTNPKIVWVVNALQQSQIALTPHALESLDKNWTEVSGQMSDVMRNSALIGLTAALICILIYITLRFEFKYALSATICLAHDIIFTIGTIAILHALKVPVQIDLNTVAALMTIVGYSLNDTIIVFDRIREDIRTMRKSSFSEIINHALNVTLSRTLMTSGTTLLVLVPLVAFGGSTIFGFALVMIIGVVFGTLSSLFIAAPLMQYFHNKEAQKQHKLVLNGNGAS